MHESEKWKWSRSVVSNSSWPHGLQPIRLLHPWDFPGKSTGVGCHHLLRWTISSHVQFFCFLDSISILPLLGGKAMTNLDSILKSREITLPAKVHVVKAIIFPVVMYGWEIWTIKKAERQKIDAFELWCWRRLSRVPWTATSQSYRESTLHIHWKDRCWDWNSNTLATWCPEPTHWKRLCWWERLKAAEGGDRGWDVWMAWVWANSGK